MSLIKFNFTGAIQEVYLSNGCYHVIAAGAAGRGNKYAKNGNVQLPGMGGSGGITSGDFCLTKRTKLYIFVGGMSKFLDDETCDTTRSIVIEGGWNGGGKVASGGAMGAGGGGTDIRIGGIELKNRVLVAGGGGGGAFRGKGGDGGGKEGGNATMIAAFEQGLAVSLGSGGSNTGGSVYFHTLSHSIENDKEYVKDNFPNSLGQEGIGGNGLGRYCGGGSGGGGYWGGAGSYNSGGGGGGSSYASSMFRNVELQQGGNSGDGYMIISLISKITCIGSFRNRYLYTFILVTSYWS